MFNLKFLSLAALLATSAICAPTSSLKTVTTEDGLEIHGVGHQGDGVYFAVFDDKGKANVEFIPANDTVSSEELTSILAERSLVKREGITCSYRYGNQGNMDNANVQLANNAQAKGYYDFHAWGWARYGNELSYFCNYQAQTLTYSIVIDFHIQVSNECGQTGYGFSRRTNGYGVNDLAVGRTYNGDSFCAGGFYG